MSLSIHRNILIYWIMFHSFIHLAATNIVLFFLQWLWCDAQVCLKFCTRRLEVKSYCTKLDQCCHACWRFRVHLESNYTCSVYKLLFKSDLILSISSNRNSKCEHIFRSEFKFWVTVLRWGTVHCVCVNSKYIYEGNKLFEIKRYC
jgi:hypothetical protein